MPRFLSWPNKSRVLKINDQFHDGFRKSIFPYSLTGPEELALPSMTLVWLLEARIHGRKGQTQEPSALLKSPAIHFS